MNTYKYKVKYKETKEALTKNHELFGYDNSDLTFKFILTVMGPMVLIFMFIYGDHGANAYGGTTFFVIKYILSWLAIFAIAMIINRTIWKKITQVTAIGTATEEYKYKKNYYKKDNEFQIEFREDAFYTIASTEDDEKKYDYERVTKILESKDTIGVVVKSPMYKFGGPQGLYGFPKTSLNGGDIEGLKQFLLKKCPNVHNRIKKF